MLDDDKIKIYEATLTPCPFCGSSEQVVTGVDIGTKWVWSVRCPKCEAAIVDKRTVHEVIEAWNRRYKKNEVEQDGDITWGFYDLWVECAKRYASECLGGRIGADRPDSDSGLDT